MKILLVRINYFGSVSGHPRDVFMPFKLSLLSRVLEKDHQVVIRDNDVLRWEVSKWGKCLIEEKWDLVVIKFNMEVGEKIAEIVAKCKENNNKTKILLLDFENNDWCLNMLKKSKADGYVWGDPAIVVKNYIKTGKLPLKKPMIESNLDKFPFFNHKRFLSNDYQIFSKTVSSFNKIKWGFLLTSRGCPFDCKFCSYNIRNSHGKGYRAMSAKRIYKELKYMVSELGINAVSFEDDIFTLDRQRVVDLCNLIIIGKIKFKWVVSTRTDCLDEELIKLMKKAGCDGMALGVESGSNKVLKAMNKGESVEEIKNILLILRKFGVAVTANVIVGYPGESRRDLEKTIKLLKETRVVMVHVHYLTLYPDTILYSEYDRKMVKTEKYNHRIYGENNFSQMSEEELSKSPVEIYKKYYLSFDYLMTYLRFRWQYWIFNPQIELSLFLRTAKYLLK